jgi:mannose-1-phosphate guanylyltransferase
LTAQLPPLDPEKDLVAVIMAGGAGTRFWPASTETRPKQFLSFFGDRSLLQRTYDRVADLIGPERVFVLTAQRFVGLVREQLPELPSQNVVGEPMRRDTAAAVALATAIGEARFDDPVMAVLTSDHLIEPPEAFQHALLSAARGAKGSDALYTFGIEPAFPATGYGYLEVGDQLADDEGVRHHTLSRIVEKPDVTRAQEYVESGRFLWNSGMFVWRASSIAAELDRQLPAHLSALRPAMKDFGSDAFDAALATAFEPLEKISVDFGIMENARNVRCVRAAFEWSDVGGFAALADHLPRDDAGNIHRGGIYPLDAKDNLVFCDDGEERVALLGVEGLLVVRAGGRTLITTRERAEDIKKLVASLPDDER